MPTSPPNDPAADRSAASSTASPAADLIGDAGPAFIEPERDELPGPDAAELAAAVGGLSWSEPRVRAILQAKGQALHGLIAVDPASDEWVYTSGDLTAIAPPLTRILNRYPATRAAAASGDELALVIGFAGYGMRSWSQRRAALQLLAAYQAEQPEPDYAAPTVAEPAGGADDDLDAGPTVVPPITGRRR